MEGFPMFLVNDTKEERRKKITGFLDSGEPAVAVLLAAANFEWTVRRTIIALGKSPTAHFTQVGGLLERCTGLDRYKKVWKDEVSPRTGKRLAEVIVNWQYFKKNAYPLRHKLIHGAQGTTGRNYANDRIESMLAAAENLIDFSHSKGVDIFQRIRTRRKPR
jgi:hypothetical protein